MEVALRSTCKGRSYKNAFSRTFSQRKSCTGHFLLGRRGAARGFVIHPERGRMEVGKKWWRRENGGKEEARARGKMKAGRTSSVIQWEANHDPHSRRQIQNGSINQNS